MEINMYASVIGKIFLDEYNHRNRKNFTAKEYFEKEFVPLFFDHEKYMIHGGNSKITNPSIKENTKRKIDLLINQIDKDPESSSAIGYPSTDLTATTSGQLSSIKLPIDSKSIYYSWIGAGLGIETENGLAMYFQNPNILYDISKGWNHYRKLLNERKQLNSYQVERWNGNWLGHLYNDQKISMTVEPNPEEFIITANRNLSVSAEKWGKILIRISQEYSDINLLVYVYKISKTNKTIGFVPIKLEEFQRPIYFYKKIFGLPTYIKDAKKVEEILGNNYGFFAACNHGSIGIKAIEPKVLRQYIPNKYRKARFPKLSNNENEQIIFKTNLVWVCAMLNNEQLIEQADKAAKIFLSFKSVASRGKTTESQTIKEILESTSPKIFINGLVPILEKSSRETADSLNFLVSELNKMPRENFSYFITLIRFKYAYHNRKEQS